ncbi:MAG: hypothetical protein ACK4KW_00510 [Gemmobacter sp.]
MDVPRLTMTRLRAGIWEGVLTQPPDAPEPEVEVVLRGRALAAVSTMRSPGAPGDWLLRIPLAPEMISDGVQTFVIRLLPAGLTLGHFTVIAGDGLEEDLRAEVDLLRAELDMLKRAFRRHCIETKGDG